MGKPGSGKGTCCEILQRKYGDDLFISDTGQLIRNNRNELPGAVQFNEYHKTRFKEINDAGLLQTSATAILHWTHNLRINYNGQPYVIMDGSPRRRYEFFALYEDLIETYNAEIKFIHVAVSDEIAIQRMEERHKKFPRPETASREKILVRIAEYNEKITPTIQIIESMHDIEFIEISNEGSREDFQQKLIKTL